MSAEYIAGRNVVMEVARVTEAAAIWPESGIDIYLGSGGAEQWVLAAVALRGVGGRMRRRLIVNSEADRKAVVALDIRKPDKIFTQDEMAAGDVAVAMTGVAGGAVLAGDRASHGAGVTHSPALRSKTGTLRFIETHHDFAKFINVGGH